MARLGARGSSTFKAISTAPSINKTPVGSSTPPLPYPVSQDLGSSVGTVPGVRFNGEPAYVLDQSTQPSCIGDAAGSAGGVKSGTVGGGVKPVAGSGTVRVGGKPVIRERDPCTLNGGNCPGIYVTESAPTTLIRGGVPSAGGNPPVKPETPEEESFWQKASPWVHGTLGLASFVPGLSLISGATDAAIYAGEGDLVGAGIAAASMIPGGKIVTTAGKLIKEAATLEKGASVATRMVKGAHDAEGTAITARVVKEAEDASTLKRTEDGGALLKQVEREIDTGGKPPHEGMSVKGKESGPCDHLRQGTGTGPYRGGAHAKTSKPVNDGMDSHHMPAKDASPLDKNDGPAIQMEPKDHAKTSSNGQMAGSIDYREKLADLISAGEWRQVMAMEVYDVRRVTRQIEHPRKYNEAMLEMLEYFKCLEKHGLLK